MEHTHQVREIVEEEAASNSGSTVLGSSGGRNGSGGHRLPDMMSTMNVVDVLPQVEPLLPFLVSRIVISAVGATWYSMVTET
jgi:hypothetical protein